MKIKESKKEIKVVNIIFDERDVMVLKSCGLNVELVDTNIQEYGHATVFENDDGTTEERRYNFTTKD